MGVLSMKISSLNGMKLITTDAYTLGEIEGAEVNTDTWQVTHLHISLTREAGKEMGYKSPVLGHTVLCLPVSFVKAIGHVITLDKTLTELKDTPECKSL
jgi:sporulation protein YlmC with PRC-barrel domain